MTVRMSATGSNTPIYLKWDRSGPKRGWKGGKKLTCWPPLLTLQDGYGIGNNLIRLMYQQPATMMPKRFAIRLMMWHIVKQAYCPTNHCDGQLTYYNIDTAEPIALSWSMNDGFAIYDGGVKRESRGELKSGYFVYDENAERAEIGCGTCGFRCPPLKPNSLRPYLRFLAPEYAGLFDVMGVVRVPMDATIPRRDRTYISCEMWRLSELGVRFAEAELDDDAEMKKAILLDATNNIQSREQLGLNSRGVNTESAREAHVFSTLTKGRPIRDCVQFVTDLCDNRGGDVAGYADMGIFQCYYGRSYTDDCSQCPMNGNVCPLQRDLKSIGEDVDENGCRQNLVRFAQAVYDGRVVCEEHPEGGAGFHPWRFRFEGGILRDFDWTEQCSKETVIPFYIADGLGLLERDGGSVGVRLWPSRVV
jgi:hypothetical protein